MGVLPLTFIRTHLSLKKGKMKMNMHLLLVHVMVLLIFYGGEVESRSSKKLLKQLLGKIDTVLSHTEILVSQVFRPITIQIDTTIGNFPVEIENITFTDTVYCPTVSVNQNFTALECSPSYERYNCLVASITAKNAKDGNACTAFNSG